MYPFFASRHRLPPKQCRCGNTNRRTCPERGLSNHRNYPPFAQLPKDNDLNEEFYGLREGRRLGLPTRHWALVAEIVEVMFFVRPRALLENQYDERFWIAFHLDDASDPKYFTWQDLQPGYTLCVLYPTNHLFLDTTRGIRQESSGTAMAFPVGLDALTQEVAAHARECQANDGHRCFHCGKPGTEESKLLRCTKCKVAMYCNRDTCQRSHWKASHRRLCHHANMLQGVADLDFGHFEGFVDWSFVQNVPAAGRQEPAASLERRFLYYRGVYPRAPSERLGSLLDATDGYSLKDFLLYMPVATFMEGFAPSLTPETLLRDTFLFSSLREFHASLSENPSKRSHVVDLRSRCRMEEVFHGAVLAAMFLSLPMRQHESFVGGICWSFETTFDFVPSDIASTYTANNWRAKLDDEGGISTFSVENSQIHASAVAADYLEMAAGVADRMAERLPNFMVIRVLRATPHPIRRAAISEAAQPNRDNIFTLWIREDDFDMGQFNTRRDDAPLVVQLLDFTPSLKSMFIASLTAVFAGMEANDDDSDDDDSLDFPQRVRCTACREVKPTVSFSKNQLRKGLSRCRCRSCVNSPAHHRPW